MTETKEILITGDAATAIRGTRRKGRGGGTRKKKLVVESEGSETRGGGSTSPGTLTQLATSSVGAVNIQKVVGAAAASTDAAARVAARAPAVEPGLPVGAQKGGESKAPGGNGGNEVKVVLKPKKKKTRLVLAPPKAPAPAANTAQAGGKKTRKVSRNIKVSLPGLNKKLTKAKTIRHEAAKASLDEIKKVLHKAGLVKTDTKAPEPILRQMYADFMVLKNRAL